MKLRSVKSTVRTALATLFFLKLKLLRRASQPIAAGSNFSPCRLVNNTMACQLEPPANRLRHNVPSQEPIRQACASLQGCQPIRQLHSLQRRVGWLIGREGTEYITSSSLIGLTSHPCTRVLLQAATQVRLDRDCTELEEWTGLLLIAKTPVPDRGPIGTGNL